MAAIALIRAAALVALMSGPAAADVAEAIDDVITPAYARLADAASSLDAAAQHDCSAPAMQAPFQKVWDAWAYIDFLRIGPVEEDGRALAMAFWPDPKFSGLRTQQALIAGDPGVIADPSRFAEVSVAARGLAGLERLLYPSQVAGDETAFCALRRATAADLDRMTLAIAAEWPAHAVLLQAPGDANPSYLSRDEARQALFTQVVTGLTSLADTRLGRPLGTFQKPRPERAEAIASGRSLRNITLSLTGMRDLALALHPDAPQTRAAFDRALSLSIDLDDPVLAGVANPQGRLKVEILQQAVEAARAAVEAEIGTALGISTGFNSKDGD
ncbi:imelysin family protein [Paracoccus benzoatiresistens]|uniref:Imelysin family protein n=1 Tax=Paracoccus benzoatiresistens TaxID=2997341 RepID=A0ABT4J5G3_9RHOB|nr:imelysin family protein [Paracoccus sp. EF6]MCZ0962370.1 imelysin family protein [Paracoccus sp. EF6]